MSALPQTPFLDLRGLLLGNGREGKDREGEKRGGFPGSSDSPRM